MKLNIDKHQWYTYENKHERPIKVMARGLHPTCVCKDILEGLKNKGFKILDAVNVIKKDKTTGQDGSVNFQKRGLPLFMLTFDRNQNIRNVYNISGILNI
jgi:hypothetical protein